MATYLDFERSIAELEDKINELRHLSHSSDINIVEEISKLQTKLDKVVKHTYTNLTPWQKVQVARHPERPQYFDYLDGLFSDFMPLAGDRCFAEDKAIVGGLARFHDQTVIVFGQQKGRDTEERLKHNFGMPKPEGYRKVQRLMQLAEKFSLPVISFVDTPGAYPGIDAEERGQAEAIARCIELCLKINVPFISVVIGEGGSGGAIAIATANRVLMLENSYYSVISPEGCASILWRSATKAPDASEALRMTAQDLLQLGVIDEVITEPLGGAQRGKKQILGSVNQVLQKHLNELQNQKAINYKEHRRQKFLNMGRLNLKVF